MWSSRLLSAVYGRACAGGRRSHSRVSHRGLECEVHHRAHGLGRLQGWLSLLRFKPERRVWGNIEFIAYLLSFFLVQLGFMWLCHRRMKNNLRGEKWSVYDLKMNFKTMRHSMRQDSISHPAIAVTEPYFYAQFHYSPNSEADLLFKSWFLFPLFHSNCLIIIRAVCLIYIELLVARLW